MFNVQRLLGPRIYDLIDRMSPGGSGDPFTGLNTHERGELANLYRLGYPRGDEFMIAQPMGQAWLWASYAERLQRDYPEYWDAFWTKPGHVGFDEPQHVLHDRIDVRATVLRPLYAKEVTEDARFQTPEYAQLRGMAQLFAGMHEMWDVPMALELDTVGNGYVLGAGVRLTTGQAAGRQLYCINAANTVLLCDGEGEASNLRLSGVLPGDEAIWITMPSWRTATRTAITSRARKSTTTACGWTTERCIRSTTPRCRRSWAPCTRAAMTASSCGSTTGTTLRYGLRRASA